MTTALKYWLNKQSLAFKLSISILIGVFFVFAVLTIFLFQNTEHIIISKMQTIGEKSVQAYVSDITHLALDTEQLVLNTKNILNQLESNDIQSVELALNSAAKTIHLSALTFTDAWVYVFPPEDVSYGTLYKTENLLENPSFKAEQISNFYDIYPWFKEVPKEEKIYWSEPYIDKKTQQPVVTCLVPFMFQNSNDFDGLVALTVDLSKMKESTDKFLSSETGSLLLISKKGLYITHPNPEVALKLTIFDLAKRNKVPELAQSGQEVLSGKIGVTRLSYSSVVNGPAIVFYAPINQLKWGLRLVYSEKEIFKPIRKIQYLMIIPFIIGMLILFLIIYQICHKSTKQLIGLSQIALQYGNGNFSKSFEENPSVREIGMLSKAMNDMRTNLLNYIQKEKEEASEKQKAESELNIARNIQKSALSVSYPQHDAFQMSTCMLPARHIGGDFYDFFFIDRNNFAIVVADVSGKGIPAALYMMKSQTLIKNIAKEKKDLAEAFYQINNELYEGNDSCMFVSAFMAVINVLNGHVEYINAGHTHPLIDTGNGYEFIRPEKNVVLGVFKNYIFKTQTLQLKPNDRLFLYTDGVTEAQGESKSLFYGEDRLQKTLEHKFISPDETLQYVLGDIRTFAGSAPQSDDITMLEFCYSGMNGDQLTIPALTENLAKVITFLKKDMDAKGLCPSAQFKVIQASEEIFINIAEYAYPDVSNGMVDILTNMKNNTYMVAFIDGGKKYNPLAIKDPKITNDFKKKKIGGLGIFLTKKLADETEYAYDNSHNILKIKVVNKD